MPAEDPVEETEETDPYEPSNADQPEKTQPEKAEWGTGAKSGTTDLDGDLSTSDELEEDVSSEESEGDKKDLGEPFFNFRPSRVLALLLLLLTIYMATTFADIWLATSRSAEGDAPAALVLGAAQYNGTPSPVLLRRLNEAAGLYQSGRVDLVVVTGGKQPGDVTTEAKAGYDYLRGEGIPGDDLRLEVQGESTYTSMAAAARFLRDEQIGQVILVTDAYHTRRVELIAEEVGLDAQVSAVGDASFGPMVRETIAVSVGRVLSFRRLDNLRVTTGG